MDNVQKHNICMNGYRVLLGNPEEKRPLGRLDIDGG
jgi:hypothetical protein